jgi:hypothetical protein
MTDSSPVTSEVSLEDDVIALAHTGVETFAYGPGGGMVKALLDVIYAIKSRALTAEKERDEALARVREVGGWQTIETAPRNGEHILAATEGTSFGWMDMKALPEVQTVVHWFDDPEEPGFYTSVNEAEP